jgi:hypothetical protein
VENVGSLLETLECFNKTISRFSRGRVIQGANDLET